MGPSGMLPSGDDPDLSDITFDELADLFEEQAQGLVEGGADLLLLETSQDILEVKAAVHGINRCFAESGSTHPPASANHAGRQRAHALWHRYHRRAGHAWSRCRLTCSA